MRPIFLSYFNTKSFLFLHMTVLAGLFPVILQEDEESAYSHFADRFEYGLYKSNMAARSCLECVWLSAVFIRFLWVCLPQTGYIYPDEFFQATEITAGDIFRYRHTRTWEWNETFPVRTPAFPYAFTGVPLYILKMAFNADTITSRMLIVAPRIFMTAASLIIDFAVYRICQHLHMEPFPSLCILGTSFITLVFYTRTFSNTAEAILFASLLLLVISSMSNGNIVCTRRDRVLHFLMGSLVSVGIWIRPTFVAFACVPLLWWFADICTLKWAFEKKIMTLLRYILTLCTFVGTGSIVTMITLALVDSHYFGYLQRSELVLTPLNFILYNLDTSTLRDHGLHPRIMHFAVNLPLLFGPMALVLYAVIAYVVMNRKFIDYAKALLSARAVNNEKNIADDYKVHFIWSMLLCSTVVSVALLSYIPHQEPRFISPLLLPLVIIFARCLVRSTLTPLAVLSWITWNIFGCVMFGVMHQGGVYPCLAYLQQYLHDARSLQSPGTAYHVTFYRTYMPPQHLLAWPSPHETETDLLHSLVLHDLKGSSKDALKKHLKKLIREEFESHDKRSEVRQ